MKIGWSLLKDEEVREMRKKLNDYQQKLMLLVGLYSGYVFCVFQFEVDEPVILTLTIVRAYRRGLEDLGDMPYERAVIAEQLISHVMRQNQWVASEKFIKFIDPLGNEFSLPYEFCESPDVIMVIYSQIYPPSRSYETDASRGDRCCIGRLSGVTRPRSEEDISSEATTM